MKSILTTSMRVILMYVVKRFSVIIVIVSLRLMFLIVQGYNRSNAYIAAQGKLYSSKHYFY